MSLGLVGITIFIAGAAAGYFIAALLEDLRLARKDRTEKVISRTRILTSMKRQHEQEVLQQIFQTVDAIHDDTENSLGRLVGNLEDLLRAIREKTERPEQMEWQKLGRRFWPG